jgi:protein dithiol:quinone oxidoreductase
MNYLKGKTGYLLGFAGCIGTVILALVIQTKYNLEPCPLCITQRMFFMGLGVLFLIGAFVKPASIWQKIFAALQVLTALGGAGWAIRHSSLVFASAQRRNYRRLWCRF